MEENWQGKYLDKRWSRKFYCREFVNVSFIFSNRFYLTHHLWYLSQNQAIAFASDNHQQENVATLVMRSGLPDLLGHISYTHLSNNKPIFHRTNLDVLSFWKHHYCIIQREIMYSQPNSHTRNTFFIQNQSYDLNYLSFVF